MSQETDDIMAALAHHFAQLDRKWRDVRDEGIMAQSARDYQIGFLTGERDELARQADELKRQARDVVTSMSRPIGYDNDVTLVSTPALRALERAVREEVDRFGRDS